jgi:DHA3 family macrolide efflux protein-like MFS transporter
MPLSSLGKNFWLFVTGRFISRFGLAVQDVAIPLYVLDKTHSGGMMTIFVLAEMLPFALLPVAGVLSDRYNRKNMMVVFDIWRGILLLGVV